MKRRYLIVLLTLICMLCLALGLTACGENTHTHTYGDPVWSWSDDYSLATATFTCTDCGDEQVKAAAIESSTSGTTITYTATVEFNGTYTDTRTSTVSGGTEQSGETHTHSYSYEVTLAATCTEYGTLTYTCSICGDSYTVAINPTGHTAADSVAENVVEATCSEEGSYDSVVYCTVCDAEISRDKVTVPTIAHTSETKIENVVDATCTEEGSYDSVVYCTVCGQEISREEITVPTIAHTVSTVSGNVVAATCTEEGSYEKVEYCTVCGTVISSEKITIEKKEHTEATPVKENETAATCTEDGLYESVVYCETCGLEISRVTVETYATGHQWNSGSITTMPTSTTSGVRTYVCTSCYATKTTTLAATNNGASSVSPSDYAKQLVSTLNNSYGLSTRTSVNASGWSVAKGYYDYLAGSINTSSYDYSQASTLTYTSGTKIGIAIGYNSYDTGAFFSNEGSNVISGTITLPGGYTATSGSIKPAMYAIQQALGVTFVDGYTGLSTSANLDYTNNSSLVATNKWGKTVDVATTDITVAASEAAKNNSILNLADYLDYMPNFKKYLDDNPVVYLSILSGLDTSTGEGSAIYVAPYFDGVDDIERYCLIRQDWAVELLDDELKYDGDTYAKACATSTSVSGGWMGTVGSYTVETSSESGDGSTFILKKDYEAARVAAATKTTALGAAYYAIAGSVYTGTSGNIVDIMNAAINANNGATGKQLATLYRAYIDVCYTNASTGGSAYGSTRSNLFNGYSAAWDVDDLVAMLRIVLTNSQNLGLDSCTSVGIFPRDKSNDRTPDIISLAAQLFGERGTTSRYEYTYIDSNGELQDARANASFWECLEKMGELASEGLIYNYYDEYSYVYGSSLKGNVSTPGNGFMMYDYSQTQTTQMFDDTLDENYMFGAISTPVSRWDVDGDGYKEEIMRFTESWRSVKTGGLAVAASVADDENKLAAVLAFIDYLYSNDGQIASTYGIQSTNGNTNPNGTWYGNLVGTAVNSPYCELVGGQWVVKEEYESMYFAYNNELYTGTLYKGKMTPIVTTELYTDFLSMTSDVYNTFRARGSFTTYARKVLGATLPMGVKDQSFENQLTATEASQAAAKVSVSIANGTIKHPTLSIDSENYWYTCVPTSLPFTAAQLSTLSDSSQAALRGFSGTNMANSKNFFSLFHHIIWEGYTGTYSQQGYTLGFGSFS